MNCYRCNAVLDLQKNMCTKCGADIRTFKKIVYASNRYYNEGLMKAQVRDLSGARESLRASLHLYKRNIQARNLLGLVLNAMGESAEGLKEWVISKNMTTGPNIADRFINNMRRNMRELDSEVHGIKKYNQALQYARNGAKDLATIQLKKVVSVHSNMVKAYELLALLYIDDGKYDQARKILQRCLEVDRGNVSALYYLRELSNLSDRGTKSVGVVGEDDREQLIIPVRFRDFGSYLVNAFYILLGAAIGLAVAWFVIVPGKVKKETAGVDAERRSYEAVISDLQGTISAMEKASESASAEASESESEAASISESESEADSVSESESESEAEKTFEVVKAVEWEQQWVANQTLVSEAVRQYTAVHDNTATVQTFFRLNPTMLSAAKKQNYRDLSNIAADYGIFTTVMEDASKQYEEEDFDAAKETFDTAYRMRHDSAEALFYAASAYDQAGDTDEAVHRFWCLLNLFPDYERFSEAEARYLELSGEDTVPGLPEDADPRELTFVWTAEDYQVQMEGVTPKYSDRNRNAETPAQTPAPAASEGEQQPGEAEQPGDGAQEQPGQESPEEQQGGQPEEQAQEAPQDGQAEAQQPAGE